MLGFLGPVGAPVVLWGCIAAAAKVVTARADAHDAYLGRVRRAIIAADAHDARLECCFGLQLRRLMLLLFGLGAALGASRRG